jgi:1,4-alpha-glucan branching enzyme
MQIHRTINQPRPFGDDTLLTPYRDELNRRDTMIRAREAALTGDACSLAEFASGHEYYGLHFRDGQWVFREWAPNATEIYLTGDFSAWHDHEEFRLRRLNTHGDWEIILPATTLRHGMLYALHVCWQGGEGMRLPAYCRRAVQDDDTKLFSAQVWRPEQPFVFRHPSPARLEPLLIYEAHAGMATEEERVGTYVEFERDLLPKIASGGYNTVQLMAVLEHPYYGSFGYHVSNFFAVSSRFGTPEEFKSLVDSAHRLGLRVIIDLIHSHAVKNEREGLSRLDGTRYQYFHEGGRGEHDGWDSLLFNYDKPEVLHFLLSNCRFWLDEYHVDGFRFDGVTSMLYRHHGMNQAFTSYNDYFNDMVDDDSIVYLALANRVIHQVRPDAVTIAEDVSGMPGLAVPSNSTGGIGFDYRLAMGVTDYWFKLFDCPDESWSMRGLWHELTNRRRDERTISYVECHDQAIVGGKTAIFRLIDKAMYDSMHSFSMNLEVDRGVALHKMTRLSTLATAASGYLNFMGNEFGHPEWIDFPREGNHWSHAHARRLWSLTANEGLRFKDLNCFDRKMLEIAHTCRIFEAYPQLLKADEDHKILAFERNGLLFIFNFHPAFSPSGYPLEVLPGEYHLILDSDAPEFGGFARLEPGQIYFTAPETVGNSLCHRLSLYLPSRSAIVLKKARLSAE